MCHIKGHHFPFVTLRQDLVVGGGIGEGLSS